MLLNIMKKILLLVVLLPNMVMAQNFYTQPSMSFIKKPKNNIIDVSFKNDGVDKIQEKLTKLRADNPESVIRITLEGKLVVTNKPLQLSDMMLLFLKKANIEAAPNATAAALIEVANGQYISICGMESAVLDGKNALIKGISIDNSGKIHMDKLNIKNCQAGGVVYAGKGSEAYGDAGSVTRTTIENCGAVGIQFNGAFNFVCTDNKVTGCKVGIAIDGDFSATANNTITKCDTGIAAISKYETIAYNTISVCGTGVSLAKTCTETLVSYNTIQKNILGLNLNSTKTKIYYNNCDNKTEVAGAGSNNGLVSNRGISFTEGNKAGCNYFNPPLIGNQHKDSIKTGKGRFDITLKGGDLNGIRTAIDAAHTTHPNDVIVAHLNGNFATVNSSDSLLVKDNECLLLTGRITGSDSANILVMFKDKITASLSGGTIDGNHVSGKKALVYITGSANVVVDSVTCVNSLAEGITKRNSNSPTYVRACTIDSCRRRGLWELASDRLIAFENKITRTLMDGIDLDAYTNTSVIMRNTSSFNRRHGVFIEEGANRHIVMGNVLNNNNNGVHLFNKEVANKFTSRNLVACNSCTENNRGISLNAAAEDKATIDNVIFNNICQKSADVGLGGFYNNTKTKDNYTSMMILKDNAKGEMYDKADYESNTVWNSIEP